jgi:ABC-type transport system involved in cytochrome c biogenesis permease subunit
MDLYAFGKLPVEMGGRVQPIDTLARNSLRMISLRERYPDENGQYRPAVKWLLELTARPEVAESLRVVRIDNPDVLDMLGLQRRQYYRYSWAEVNQNKNDLDRARAGLEGHAAYTAYEKKLAELDKRISLYETLRYAFLHRPISKRPTEAEYKADPQGTMQSLTNIKQRLESLPAFQQALAEHHPPLAVPPLKVDGSNSQQAGQPSDDRWEPYSVAWMINYLNEIRHEPVNPATVAWESIFDAYAKQDAQAFNRAVRNYAELLEDQPPPEMSKASPAFEAWFNHWSPFFDCQWLYFTAFCLAALAWLGWSRPLNRTAFWLIAVTFVAHTFALAARMYISGRPPVTNLYSSAIFIGWAAVLAGLILEAVYRLGFGNVLASVAGFATLLIADKLSLALDNTHGDTIGVMQAVLDTQFWLATHVTCVTLGYTATLVAGLLGLIFVVRGLCTPTLAPEDGRNLARMIYGTVCFAIFFSFVGTVLGGLWADDSWGRFWGWDPKENGALIIVLWNALVLHAR